MIMYRRKRLAVFGFVIRAHTAKGEKPRQALPLGEQQQIERLRRLHYNQDYSSATLYRSKKRQFRKKNNELSGYAD